MNLQKLKQSLSECHIKSTDDISFYEDSGTKYLLERAKEEITKLDKELASGKHVKDRTKKIIQLILMVRVKTDETIRQESNGSRRTRSKNPEGTGVVSAV